MGRLRGFADSDESVSTRRAEEEAVLPATPHGLTFLPLLERRYAEQGGRQDFTAVVASQVPHISPPGLEVDDPELLPPFERYWLLTG